MSRSLNKAILIGNCGNDPEVKSTQNGSRVASFSLATSKQWSDRSGEKQEKTEWHRCVAWNNGRTGTGLADIIDKYVRKGSKLYVEGEIQYRSYEDRDGQKRYITEINVTQLLMLGARDGESNDAPASRSPRPAHAGAKSKKQDDGFEDFSDFPGALEDDDDDIPF